MRLLSIVMLSVATLVDAKKAAATEEPDSNAVVEYFMGIFNAVFGATLGAAQDCLDLIIAAPPFVASVYVHVVDFARSSPALVKNVYNGDAKTLDDLTDFCSSAAGIIFVTYASLTALNLFVSLLQAVRDYFSAWMVIPTKVPILGQKLPDPLMQVRNMIQTHCVDRVRNFNIKGWMVPLEGQSGKPSLQGAATSLASCASVCMILSSTGAVHALMKNGANEADAKALAWTIGTALGVQYLIKLNA